MINLPSLPHNPIFGVDHNSTIQNQLFEICSRSGLHLADFNEWDKPLGYKLNMSESDFKKWAWTDTSIQWMADPYPGVAQRMVELSKLGKVWIVTSTSNPQILPAWYRKHNIYYDQIILTDNKGDVEWDILFDDRPSILEEFYGKRPILRHPIPWNAYLPHIPIIDWSKPCLELK